MKISLGCGKNRREGFLGLDIVDFGWNKVWDARIDRIPADDDSCEYIEAENFVEHIARENWPNMFNECWRVLKRNGIIDITVPDAGKDLRLAVQDPTHLSLIVPGTFTAYLAGDRPRNAEYAFKKWEIVSIGPDSKDERVFNVKMKPRK